MRIEREVAAPPARVFRAFTSADEIRRWFSPEHFTTPDAIVEAHAGGVFAVCMRAPDGAELWSRGRFDELREPGLVAFSGAVVVGGETKFSARTRIDLTASGRGTLIVVQQDYEVHDPAFGAAVDGAPEGWRTTLDKLERLVAEA